ncbi:PTS system sorbose subfamily IIB component [Coriobacterium glomerans PW2]|uniref:PTS system sorbose subfamily IIB component n=1 Tax=Coriobacterium glomerans (strain ATCC 49209 / DSM 20642 / JCM 10262 / PW2) TaxID=700015 RepID=F2N7V2_CORGP|nr:PTS sugar transporter subunit IIB [Coriobacterium glomerans]AEB07061.1 PTS system sorbose subfamily IIB component [Coriobacterium glomerans PW2]
MRNVVLARVDDRLIHGEVVSVWTPSLSANCILVADDAVAQDKFNSRVLKSLAPDGVKVFVATIEAAIKGLNKEPVPGERVIVLTKSPITFLRMIEAGVPITQVNLGGMGLHGNRAPFIKNVAADPDEVAAIKKMHDSGVHVYYQLVPEQAMIEVNDALKRMQRQE